MPDNKQGAFDWMGLLGTILQFVQNLRKNKPVSDSQQGDTFAAAHGDDALQVLAYHQSCALAQTLELLKAQQEECDYEAKGEEAKASASSGGEAGGSDPTKAERPQTQKAAQAKANKEASK